MSGQGKSEGENAGETGIHPLQDALASGDFTGPGTCTFSGSIVGVEADSRPVCGYQHEDTAGRWRENSKTLRDRDWKHGRGFEPIGDDGTYRHDTDAADFAAAGLGEAPEDAGADLCDAVQSDDGIPGDEVTRSMLDSFRKNRFPAP